MHWGFHIMLVYMHQEVMNMWTKNIALLSTYCVFACIKKDNEIIYEQLGHDKFKIYFLLDITFQCAYVFKLATINWNLCFCYLNITKATVKRLSLKVICVTLWIPMIYDIDFNYIFNLSHFLQQRISNIIIILVILILFRSPCLISFFDKDAELNIERLSPKLLSWNIIEQS